MQTKVIVCEAKALNGHSGLEKNDCVAARPWYTAGMAFAEANPKINQLGVRA